MPTSDYSYFANPCNAMWIVHVNVLLSYFMKKFAEFNQQSYIIILRHLLLNEQYFCLFFEFKY